MVTSDNPRFEDPQKIIDEVMTGFDADSDVCSYVDRLEAIKHAVGIAQKGDVIALCGKGHEEYQVIGDTTVYQVGELTTDGVNDPNTLIVKLLKSSAVNSRSPLWKLMMKNVYFLKSTQIQRNNFRLNILYENPEGGVGIGYFTEGPLEATPLIQVFGLDRMDASQSYYYPDGVFDWFDSAAYKGGTIQSASGRIFFPYVEPFGKDLREMLGDNALANRYCFDSLYTMTQSLAQQYADKNKFYLEGYYTSSVSGEIQLGYSVTQGSVTVTAGGMPLIENVDYTVDYTMGTVTILNTSISHQREQREQLLQHDDQDSSWYAPEL